MAPGELARHAVPPEGNARARVQRALKLTTLFERASRASRETAAAAGVLEVVPGGAVVIRQGSVPDALVLIGRGRARIDRTSADGRVLPLGYRGAGDVLGASCLGGLVTGGTVRSNPAAHAENATAMEEMEVVRFPLPVVDALLAGDAEIGGAALALLLARQRETEDRIASLLFRDVDGRLAEFLVRAADRWGVPSPKGTLISAPLTHLEIAQSIGSTRETVTLALGALRREGLLEVAGRRLIVRDRDALAAR